MVPYYGDFAEDDTVIIPINTFSSDDPSASVTATNLLNTDVHIHKDGGTTQRNNAAGITMTIDYDSITGNHLLIIDTSDNTVAGFYVTGSEYQVRVEGVTVDGATINAWVGAFSVERAGGALAVAKLIQTAVIANAAGTDIAADIIAIKAETALIVADTNELQADDYPTSIAAIKAETALIVADTNELQTDDLPTLIATAQADLDTITGTDGVTLATAQALYAPNIVVPATKAEMDTAHALLATPAQVNTEVLDVLNVDTFAEPGDEAPAATSSLVNKIGYLFKFLRNKVETTATRIHVYNDAADNKDHSSVISDDGSTFTRDEFGAGDA